MIEEGLGIGSALRAAREKKGWTTQEAGSRLRLMARQIEAIEQEDFARLGQPVFARGFVRNYAKLLGLNPDELLEQMTRIKTTPVQETENLPFTPGDEFWKSPWVLGGIAAVILLLAIPVSLYLWLNSEEEAPEAAAVERVMPPLPPPAPVTEPPPAAPVPQTPPAAPASAQPVAPVPAAPASVPQPAAPAPVQPLAPAPANAPAALPVPAKPAQAVATPAAPPAVARPSQPFPAQTPAAPVKPAAPPVASPVQQPVPIKPAAPVVQAPAPSALANVRMQFDQPAWVQVRDSTGRTLHSGLNPMGGSVEVSGKPPFYLVVGNAANVRVTYKGKPVDLKPYIDVTVARITLNP